MAKMKSGWTDYVGPRVRSERTVVKGVKSDAAQFGIRSPGRSKATRSAESKTRGRGNVGSFGNLKRSSRASINTGGNFGKIGYS